MIPYIGSTFYYNQYKACVYTIVYVYCVCVYTTFRGSPSGPALFSKAALAKNRKAAELQKSILFCKMKYYLKPIRNSGSFCRGGLKIPETYGIIYHKIYPAAALQKSIPSCKFANGRQWRLNDEKVTCCPAGPVPDSSPGARYRPGRWEPLSGCKARRLVL